MFGTGTGWPDFIVAAIMAALGTSGGLQILTYAWSEFQSIPEAVPANMPTAPPRPESGVKAG